MMEAVRMPGTGRLLEPETIADVAGVVADAAAAATTLTVIGGGTRAPLIDRTHAAATLSTRKLAGILDYTPAEMTMTALAGTSMAEIAAALAEKGQMLAFEPFDHRPMLGSLGEPTIGGVFSANISGPRRIVAGAARDHLLGLHVINGRGESVKAGGRVMKNVTGLDLVKLLAGARGTLGVVTDVTFKVLPRPPAAATLVVSGLEDDVAARLLADAMAMPTEVSGAAHLPESVSRRFLHGRLPEGPATVLRIEGLATSVESRAGKLHRALSAVAPVSRLDTEETGTLWREIATVLPYADGTDRPLWRVSVAPSAGHRLVAALRLQAGVDAFYDWQGGLVWLRMEADPEAALLRGLIRSLGGGHATLMRAGHAAPHAAPHAARTANPAFEPLSPLVAALSQRVKASLDPVGIFNPGVMTS